MACVGKYRTTLAQLPLHKESTPSYLIHLPKQSIMPKLNNLLVTFVGITSEFRIVMLGLK